MKKVEIVIVVIAILIVVISGTSAGFAIPIVQAIPDDSNNQQASDDSNDVITFEGIYYRSNHPLMRR